MKKNDVSIQCSDGVVLTGTLYCPNKYCKGLSLLVQQQVLEGKFTLIFHLSCKKALDSDF